ncbi:unnamed protein product [Penicillium olsonii]|nr:unnamed protein product [Penicillium olsonii]CAG7929459.1 unnamed protein product [Penicillium olsonii]
MLQLNAGISMLCILGLACSAPTLNLRSSLGEKDTHWVNIWTTMPQLVEPGNLPPVPFNGSESVFQNTTIRQTLQVSLPAEEIRIRLSNTFGINELSINKVTVSLPTTQQVGLSASQEGSMQVVSFNGRPNTVIPNGALAVSDPIKISVKAQSPLMISIFLENGQEGFSITGHPGSRTTSYLAFGDWVDAQNITQSSVQSTDHCWPDLLLRKLQKHDSTSRISISNQAAGGNRILQDGLGPNVLSRLDRDVLAQSGVRFAMIFEGVNDIGVADPDTTSQLEIEERLIAAYRQIATRIHAVGIPVFGATITPFGSSSTSDYIQPYSSPVREKTRQRINTFIRKSGIFDAVLDFDRVLRDPLAPGQLLEKYDSGDHLHPNVAGYQALADYFPLEILVES